MSCPTCRAPWRGTPECPRCGSDLAPLMRVVSIWADAALRLSERDLRLMERLVRAQNKTAEDSEIAATVTPIQRAAAL